MKLRIVLALIGAAIYCASLFQPVWSCSISQGRPLDGLTVLMTGYLGLLFFDPRWFCNVVVLLGLAAILYPPKRFWVAFVLAGVASTTILGPFFCAPGGGALGNGTALSTGGYLWIFSLWLFAIAGAIRPDKD